MASFIALWYVRVNFVYYAVKILVEWADWNRERLEEEARKEGQSEVTKLE